MNLTETIKDVIRQLSKENSTYSVVCNVSDIDLNNKICNCTPINGDAILMNVRLVANNNKGFMLIPKDGSIVVVTLINNTTGYVSMCSEVDEVWLNGDNYGGIIRIQEITNKLNNLENAFNQHLNLYNMHTHAGVTSGTSTTTPVVIPDTQTLTPTTESEIVNETVKHGNGN